jgi:N-acetylglucosamine kinase-like BadF-type ATPase
VIHGGTGSFVAARGLDETTHYAGGLGWRLGDPGSGYDLGRRAIAASLLEMQGWNPQSRLSALVQAHTGLNDPAAITRQVYADPQANAKIAALAPGVVKLAEANDSAALSVVIASLMDLLELAERVSGKLFPATPPSRVRSGVSGPILTRPFVLQHMRSRSSLTLTPIEERPIEGVRRLLLRSA